MKRWIVLSLGLLVVLFLGLQAAAQETKKKAKAGSEDRLSGRIQMISKDTSQITLLRNNVKRTVVYSPETKITLLNKPSTMDEVKEGKRVICLGKFNEKGQLVATRIDVRGN